MYELRVELVLERSLWLRLWLWWLRPRRLSRLIECAAARRASELRELLLREAPRQLDAVVLLVLRVRLILCDRTRVGEVEI